MNTFPRIDGKCKIHNIPNLNGLRNELYANADDFEIGLKYLRENNINLIRGDVLYFESQSNCYHNSLGFYDGNNCVELGHLSEFGSIPSQFHVIEEDVPIKYWDDALSSIVVHFNHSLVIDQCLNNIKYDLLEAGIYGIFTTFTYNDKLYKIVWDYYYEDNINDSTYEILNADTKSELLNEFKNKLLNKDLNFYHTSEYSLKGDSNILFI
jgi:hypothetical protein